MFIIKNFINTTIHLSKKINKWNPRISYYILGIRDNIYIIDLEQTLIMIKRALNYIKQISLNKGYIYYILPILSNYKKCLNKKINTHNNLVYPLVEKKLFNKKIEINKLNKIDNLITLYGSNNIINNLTYKRNILGLNPIIKNYNINNINNVIMLNYNTHNNKIKNIWLKPEILFIPQINKNIALIKEGIKLQIPIIGILNNNSYSYGIQYPIPGNDNTNEALNLYIELVINTIINIKNNEIKSLII